MERIARIPGAAWKPYKSLDPHASRADECQWAEVTDFIPRWNRNYKKGTDPYRYIAGWARSRQLPLVEDEQPRWRHFAIMTNTDWTNMDWRGDRLLRWRRQKQGTVEHGHGTPDPGTSATALVPRRAGFRLPSAPLAP